MATLLELSHIKDDDRWNDLLGQIRVACAKKAATIIDSASPGTTALEWAKSTLMNINRAGDDIAMYVIAWADNNNESISIDLIYDAAEATIVARVSAAVDAIYGV